MDSSTGGGGGDEALGWGWHVSAAGAGLGLCGILRGSFSILGTRPKLFAALALTLTLPLCFVVLAHNLAIDPVVSRIDNNTDAYLSAGGGGSGEQQLRRRITADRIRLGFLLSAYLLLLLLFGLVSTAATVYSVACIFAKRGLSYGGVLRAVPRVWRRLLLTFLWAFVLVLLMVGAFMAAVLLVYVVLVPMSGAAAVAMWWAAAAVLAAALFHVACVVGLAAVVSVLEQGGYGVRALKKASELLRGRRGVAYGIFAIGLVLEAAVALSFDLALAAAASGPHRRRRPGPAAALPLAAAFALALAAAHQLLLVASTLLYFSCKSHHHECIDAAALSHHLASFSPHYVDLRSDPAAVQIEAALHRPQHPRA